MSVCPSICLPVCPGTKQEEKRRALPTEEQNPLSQAALAILKMKSGSVPKPSRHVASNPLPRGGSGAAVKFIPRFILSPPICVDASASGVGGFPLRPPAAVARRQRQDGNSS